MDILIVAAGKGRGTEEQALAERWIGRAAGLGRAHGIGTVDIREADDRLPAKTPAREAKRLVTDRLLRLANPTQNAGPAPLCVPLDSSGQVLSSEVLAARLEGLRDRGTGKLAFLIGASNGLALEHVPAPPLVLSFGAATWPHLLVRAMLAEQIYRALTILAGHPYHRDA
ncbi:MAG: 23S rRNA (pseudouridine(1915)-N(3))-methyltransferase RlmH [Pseudomonadota bacterium]